MGRGRALKGKKTELLTVRVGPDVVERVYRMAQEEQVSAGAIVRRALDLMLGNGASAKSQEVTDVPRP